VNSHGFTHESSQLLRESIFHYRVNNSSWLVLILSQVGPIQSPVLFFHLRLGSTRVPQGFLYHLVTRYTILYPLCSSPVTFSWIWINELMYDEYLLYSDITQRALPYVTPSCYVAELLMNIQQGTHLSINICRFPHNIHTTVILKLNSITLTHFSFPSRDSWRAEYYYNAVFETATAFLPDVTICLWVSSRRLYETLGNDHRPWTRQTPAELNPLLLQLTALVKSIISCKTTSLPTSLSKPSWSNICVRMYLNKLLNASWRVTRWWRQKYSPKHQ
jgi:hypothetical protein